MGSFYKLVQQHCLQPAHGTSVFEKLESDKVILVDELVGWAL